MGRPTGLQALAWVGWVEDVGAWGDMAGAVWVGRPTGAADCQLIKPPGPICNGCCADEEGM